MNIHTNQPSNSNLNFPFRQAVSHYDTQNLNEQINKKPYEINNNYRVFPDTFHINQPQQIYQYKPKIIMSGYIVGDPVAFTETSELPKNYMRFTPQKQNIHLPMGVIKNIQKFQTSEFLQASSIKKSQNPHNFNSFDSRHRSNSVNISDQKPELNIRPGSNFIPNQPYTPTALKNLTQVISSSRIIQHPQNFPTDHLNCISKQEYQRLLADNRSLSQQNKTLESENLTLKNENSTLKNKVSRISELQNDVEKFKSQLFVKNNQNLNLQNNFQKGSIPSSSSPNFSSLPNFHELQSILLQHLQKYRRSILEQQKLLINRFRLECKNQEIEMKKHQLDKSRQQMRKSLTFQTSKQLDSDPRHSSRGKQQQFQLDFLNLPLPGNSGRKHGVQESRHYPRK